MNTSMPKFGEQLALNLPTFTLRPLDNRVALRLVDTAYKGKLVIPDAAKDAPVVGVVLAIGSTVLTLSVGDKVVFGRYSGHSYTHEGEEILLMKEIDVLAVILDDRP